MAHAPESTFSIIPSIYIYIYTPEPSVRFTFIPRFHGSGVWWSQAELLEAGKTVGAEDGPRGGGKDQVGG